MNNFYTSADKIKRSQKTNNNNHIIKSYMNKTSMISDILTTQQSTVAATEENYNPMKNTEKKFNVNPDYIKQIHTISNDKTIDHLLNVIVIFFNIYA